MLDLSSSRCSPARDVLLMLFSSSELCLRTFSIMMMVDQDDSDDDDDYDDIHLLPLNALLLLLLLPVILHRQLLQCLLESDVCA